MSIYILSQSLLAKHTTMYHNTIVYSYVAHDDDNGDIGYVEEW